jgi:hypothetical protein
MAFNIDHTASGDLNLAGSYSAFTGSFTFPKPLDLSRPSVFLAEGAANISAITGLQACLNLLVNTNEVGTASTLNADNNASGAMLVNNSNLINVGVLPDSVHSSVFVVSNSGQLTLLSEAKKGSVAYTSNNYKTYVLCGTFNNINNWVGLLNPDICIDSVNSATGIVLISGKDLSSSAGYGANAEVAIQYLSTGYVDSSYLSSEYETEANFDNELSNYATISSLNSELASYPTTGETSGCLSNYTNNNGTGALFAPYTLQADLGTAAESQHNVGTGSSCILCVGSSGCIDSSVLPDISLVESFIISSQNALTGLTTATIGDVAFDTVNKFNYILTSCAVGAYSSTGNWARFSAEEGSLLNVNNHTADPNSTVTLYSNDVCMVDDLTSYTISDKFQFEDAFLSGIESDYKISGSLVSDRSGYVTEAVFNNIASGKSDVGHVHVISDITDLDSCLSDISPFLEANLINLQKSYSYKLSNSGSAISCGSLILGNEGKAKNNYSIVQGAGKFAELGDAQHESIVGKLNSPNADWNNIIQVQLDTSSIALFNADLVSRSGDAFGLQGVVVRELGSASIPEEPSKSIYATGNVNNDVRVCSNSSGFALQVKGQSYWMSNLEMVSTKSTGVSAPDGIGLYWNNASGSSWFSVAQNWFTENTLTAQASSLPSGSSNVFMNGSVAAVVDLDNANWVQPSSINTTSVTDSLGIIFTSANNEVFSGVVYGNASFSGNASFQ